MEKTLTEVCEYLNNYFWRSKREGTITISGGTINADYLQEGHQYPATDLYDEVFEGSVWSMAVPQTVIDLASDITAWKAKYAGVNSPAMSPYNSESFSGYTYSKSGSGTPGSGSNVSWQDVFQARLAPYRRLRGAR